MGKAIEDSAVSGAEPHVHRRDLRKSMSDNVAIALIVYTGLHIFFTVHAMKEGVSSTAPYFGLAILVALIIPACRWFEKRWANLTDEEAHGSELLGAFRRDLVLLWGLAIGLPMVLTGLFKLAYAAFG